MLVIVVDVEAWRPELTRSSPSNINWLVYFNGIIDLPTARTSNGIARRNVSCVVIFTPEAVYLLGLRRAADLVGKICSGFPVHAMLAHNHKDVRVAPWVGNLNKRKGTYDLHQVSSRPTFWISRRIAFPYIPHQVCDAVNVAVVQA